MRVEFLIIDIKKPKKQINYRDRKVLCVWKIQNGKSAN